MSWSINTSAAVREPSLARMGSLLRLDLYTSAARPVSLADAVAVHHRKPLRRSPWVAILARGDGVKRRDLLSLHSPVGVKNVHTDGSRRVHEPDTKLRPVSPSHDAMRRPALRTKAKDGTGALP